MIAKLFSFNKKESQNCGGFDEESRRGSCYTISSVETGHDYLRNAE